MNSKKHLVVLLVTLAVGGGLRFYRLDWGRMALFHPDEARISYAIGDIDRQVVALRSKLAAGERVGFAERIRAFNPHFFAYGSLPLYLIRSTHRILGNKDLFSVGRGWSAFFDTLSILVVFLLGRRLFGARAGCLASLFFAFTVFHIQLAHFITVDAMLTSLVLIALFFCSRIMGEGRFRDYTLAGFFAGVALATKVSAAPVVIPLIVAHAAFSWRCGRGRSPLQWGKLLAGLAVLAAVFLVCEPFVLLDRAEFMRQVEEQKNMVRGIWAPPWTLQYEHTIKGFYQLKNLIAYCMGPPLGVAVVAGSAFLVLRRFRGNARQILLVLSWLIPVGAATLSFKVKFIRYLSPLIPFLCILGAAGICLLADELRGRGARILLRALVGFVIAYSLFYSLAYMSIYRHDDTRVEASTWIYENLPPRSRILGETWEFQGLPVGTAAGNPGMYTVRALDIYRADDRGKAKYLAEELAQGDLIALPTKRMYGSVLRVPERYPVTSNYYRLLFEGRLGYRLVKSVTSYPRLWGMSFNDDRADESFTVYDHPKVLLFRKTVNYPKEYLRQLIAAQPKIDYWPVLDDALGADEFNRGGAQAGTLEPAPRGYTPPAPRSAASVLVWLLTVELMGLVALPLTASFFGGLPDKGYPFAKVMAIALTGYLVWLAASLGAAPFSRPLILAALGLVLLLSWRRAAGEGGWRTILAARIRGGALSEAVFLITFGLFLVFRRYNPDIFWSESSMDFSFITSILRSRSFPPIDPWASGIYLNYYYYGHYLVAMLTKLSGVPPQIGYNLAFSLIPALVLSGIFSIVRGVTGRARYGLFGAAVAGLAGNLDGLFLLIDMQPWRDAVYRSLHLVLPTHREHVFRFFRCAHEVIQNTVHEFPFWSFTFVDLHAHVIAMPFAVFLLAFCLNIIMRSRSGFGAFGTGAAGVENYCIAAVVLGMTVPMNTWDFPIYLAAITLMLLAADVIIRGERPHRIPLSSQSFWWDSGFRGRMLCAVMSIARLEGPIGGALGVALRVGAPAMLLGAAAIGAYAPLFIFFGREGMGLGLVGDLTTPAEALLRFFGFFLFIIASYLALELVRYADGSAGLWKRLAVIALCAAVAALPWAAFDMTGTRDYASLSLALLFLLAGCLVLRRRGADRRVAYALLLIVYGMAIIALCELFHIRDFYQGGSHKRFNTIFKFYIAVWYFFAIGGSFCLSRFMAGPVRRREGWRRAVILSVRALWAVVFIALCAAALVFTVMGPRARTIGDDNYPRTSLEPRWDGGRSGSGLLATMFPRALSRPTLDGFSYMKARLPDEYDAISWLNDTVAGQPVIAEDTGADYLYEYARVASNTGLPTILGWWSHVDQRGYKYGEGRKNDVFKLYRSLDPLELATLIAKYDIQLIFVGNTERRHYRPDAIEKFNALTGLFRHVFHSKTVDIYQTASSPAFAQETEMRKEGGGAQAAAPIVIPRARMLEGGQGDGPGQYNEPRGIAIDGKGNVYVADFRNYRIQKFDSKGLFVNAWGEEGEFPGQFKDPCGVAVDASGRVYVADTFNNRVQVFSGDGKFLSSFEGGFFAPRGIAVDGRGRIWVTDTGNGAVKLFSPEGELINTVGKRGKGEGEFDGPTGIAVDSKGMAYVADAGNRRIQVLDRNGKLTRVFKVDGWEPMVFDEPYLALDGRGDIYLTDPPGNRVLKYSPQGKLLGVLKPMEGAEPLLSFPMGVAVEKDGQAIYIVDCRHHRIQKFSKRDLIHVK